MGRSVTPYSRRMLDDEAVGGGSDADREVALVADELREVAAAARMFASNAYEQDWADRTMAAAARLAVVATGDTGVTGEFAERGWDRLSPLLGAAAIVLDRDGRVLLARRADNGCWNLPGGLVEVGESPSMAALRELWEEVGVRGTLTGIVGVYNGPDWGTRSASHLVHIDYVVQADDLQPSVGVEMTEAGYFPPRELPEPMMPGHQERIERGMIMLAHDRTHFDPLASTDLDLPMHQRPAKQRQPD